MNKSKKSKITKPKSSRKSPPQEKKHDDEDFFENDEDNFETYEEKTEKTEKTTDNSNDLTVDSEDNSKNEEKEEDEFKGEKEKEKDEFKDLHDDHEDPEDIEDNYLENNIDEEELKNNTIFYKLVCNHPTKQKDVETYMDYTFKMLKLVIKYVEILKSNPKAKYIKFYILDDNNKYEEVILTKLQLLQCEEILKKNSFDSFKSSFTMKKKNKKEKNSILEPQNATSVHAPVRIGASFLKFFMEKSIFGKVTDPSDETKTKYLIDCLPCLKMGFALKNTCSNLIYTLIYLNNEEMRPMDKKNMVAITDHMQDCFGISPAYIFKKGNSKKNNNKDIERFEMRKWAKEHNNKVKMSTFDVIIKNEKDSNDGESELEKSMNLETPCLKNSAIQSIIALNTLSSKSYETIFENIFDEKENNGLTYRKVFEKMTDNEFIQLLINEHNFVSKTKTLFKEQCKK